MIFLEKLITSSLRAGGKRNETRGIHRSDEDGMYMPPIIHILILYHNTMAKTGASYETNREKIY